MQTQNNQAPIALPATSKLATLPSLAELEVCPTLILEAPLQPAWAEGLAFHRTPHWLRGEEEAAADMDRLDLAEVSFKLPNAPEGSLVRMTFWQFAYTAVTAAGGFSLYVKPVDGLPYVHLCACQHSQHPREDKPRRYVSTVARLLEDATKGKVVTYKAGDRFDLRPHAIELTSGTGREATTAAVRRHLRRILTASNHPYRRDYMRLLTALQARCKDGSETYRRAFHLAEEAKRNRREGENPSIYSMKPAPDLLSAITTGLTW